MGVPKAEGTELARKAFTYKATVDAHSLESVEVKETKTNVASSSVETNHDAVSSSVTKDLTKSSVKTVSNNEIEGKEGILNCPGERKASDWDRFEFKRKLVLEIKKPEAEIPALEREELPLETSCQNLKADILVCGKCKSQFSDVDLFLGHKKTCKKEPITTNVMEKILFEYFYLKITSIINISIEVTNKVFRRRIGFGFITENKRYFKSKAVRADKGIFFSQDKQSLALSLSGYHPYSEVYNIWQTNTTTEEERTFFIFRHFLKWESLTEEQRKSLTVATSLDGNNENVIFVDPIFVDEEYVVIEQRDCTWFLVVSKFGSLPLRMKSMFEKSQRSSLTCSMSLTGLSLFQKLILGSFTDDILTGN